MLIGSFPADAGVRDAVGGGYDLFLSKNVLKRGYIHPERPAEEKHIIKLGVDDETFVRTIYGMLVPGGRALIYNLAPAQAPPDKPYITWADGRCPFARELWEKAGFKVIEFDRDDTPAARAMGHTLGWDEGEDKMDLERDLFGTYTLVEKPRGCTGAGAFRQHPELQDVVTEAVREKARKAVREEERTKMRLHQARADLRRVLARRGLVPSAHAPTRRSDPAAPHLPPAQRSPHRREPAVRRGRARPVPSTMLRGTEGGTRTLKPFRVADFESAAFAIPPLRLGPAR